MVPEWDKRVQPQPTHPNLGLQQLKEIAGIPFINENLAPLIAPRRDLNTNSPFAGFSKAAPSSLTTFLSDARWSNQ